LLQPPLIATTIPGPIQVPTDIESYSILKELRCLGDHLLASSWDSGLAYKLCHALNTMSVDWTSLDLVHIPKVEESSTYSLVIILFEVKPRTLPFERGSQVAINCHKLINCSIGISKYHIEICKSCIMRHAGNRFLDPGPFANPTLTACHPYTATLGILISTKPQSGIKGTGGLFLSADVNDKGIYLMTAWQVVLPTHINNNKEYYHQNNSK